MWSANLYSVRRPNHYNASTSLRVALAEWIVYINFDIDGFYLSHKGALDQMVKASGMHFSYAYAFITKLGPQLYDRALRHYLHGAPYWESELLESLVGSVCCFSDSHI